MADILDNTNPTREDKREQRKAEREQRREERVTKQLASETGKYGIDLKDLGPTTPSRKKEILEEIKASAPKELISDIELYSKRYTPPTPAATPTLDEKTMRDQIKKERRMRWIDAISALGTGLSGRTYDPSQGFAARSRAGREAQMQQYKDVVEANRQRAKAWDAQYKQEMVDYLQKQIDEGTMSPLEQQKVQAQINKMKAETETEKARQKYWLSKATRDAQTAKEDVAKGKSATYKYKTNDGREMSLNVTDPNIAATLTNAITESDRLKAERDRIQSEMDNAIYMAESTGFLGMGKSKEEVQAEIRAKHQPLLAEAEDKLRQSEETITSIFQGRATQPASQAGTELTPQAGEKTPLDDILENL